MDLAKNDNDKLPEEMIEHRASTYQRMMRVGYIYGLPIVLGIVMFLTLLLLDVNGVVAFILGILAWLGVLGFSKTFFVH